MLSIPCAFCGKEMQLRNSDLIPTRIPFPHFCPACGGKNRLGPQTLLIGLCAMFICIYAAGLVAKIVVLDQTWAWALSLFAAFTLGWPLGILASRRSAKLIKWSWSWP
jgi:hypothetical protein